jgi:hypothetical protein
VSPLRAALTRKHQAVPHLPHPQMQVEVVDFIEALEVTYLQFLQYLINKSFPHSKKKNHFHILKKCENTFVPLSIMKMTNESLEKNYFTREHSLLG